MQYRGALHLHSTYSYDGKVPLAELAKLLRAQGLSFACVTEHTDTLTTESAKAFVQECAALSDDTFLLIPGFEACFKDTHILLFGCETFVTQRATDTELVAWKSHASLAVLAHPHRNGYRTSAIPDGVLDGIEIWNSQYDGKYVPRNGARRLFARMHAQLPLLRAYAGWDLHRRAHEGGPVVSIACAHLDRAGVLAALKTGAYELQSTRVSLASDGTLTRGNPLATHVESSVVVFSIRIFKVINRVLAWFGIRLPSGLVAFVRRRM